MTDHAAVIRESLTRCPAHDPIGVADSLCPACVSFGTACVALAALEQETDRWCDRADQAEMREGRERRRAEAAEAELAEAKRKIGGCPICSQAVPGPSWRDTP